MTLYLPARFRDIPATPPLLAQRVMLLQSVLERLVPRVLTTLARVVPPRRVRDRSLQFLQGLPRLSSPCDRRASTCDQRDRVHGFLKTYASEMDARGRQTF